MISHERGRRELAQSTSFDATLVLFIESQLDIRLEEGYASKMDRTSLRHNDMKLAVSQNVSPLHRVRAKISSNTELIFCQN